MLEIRSRDSYVQVVVDGEPSGRRFALDEVVSARLQGLSDTYDALVRHRPDDVDAFRQLGSELFDWIDGDSSVLRNALKTTTDRSIEIATGLSPSAAERIFLGAPWELLALDGAYLARHEIWRISIARRIGDPQQSAVANHYRLGLAFMAAAPRGEQTLDFEAEEAAILEAVEGSDIDLVVEESGNLKEFQGALAGLDPMTAVHLSCHGINSWKETAEATPVPALATENEYGDRVMSTTGDVIGTLLGRCEFAFLSACLTSSNAEALAEDEQHNLLSQAMTTSLVEAGVPAVMGWAGSVKDRSATDFAARFYGQLAKRSEVSTAVADARRPMIDSENELDNRDWHMARLWLGPSGGGAVVGGTKKRPLLPVDAAKKAFLGRNHVVPVAGPEMFVGRRRDLQTILRVLDGNDKAGVLVQGIGRLGKSSLAARAAARRPSHALAVVHGAYDALSVVAALQEAVAQIPAARDLLDQREAEVREDPRRLYQLLLDFLSQPDTVDGVRPLLLVIDDLEQVLETSPDSDKAKVSAAAAPVLEDVIRAFDVADTRSDLLFTSRFTFKLGGLEDRLHHHELRRFTVAAQRKLAYRNQAVALERPPSEVAARSARTDRVVDVSRGNPGLQDLIGLRLLYSEELTIEQVDAVLSDMESWLSGGDLPGEAQVREFLENLAVEGLLAGARPDSLYLLTALRTFRMPIPVAIAEQLAVVVGGSVDQLIGLGLTDAFEDMFAPQTLSIATCGLVAGRIEEPDDGLTQDAAATTLENLFAAWGGVERHNDRPTALDVELTRLACDAWGNVDG